MLYTEDTYELPGVPCMGYLRGSYSLEEMRELDEYAARFGIEMVACIQTLGHLGQFLKWPGAAGFRDTDDVLLTDHVETYELIDRIFNFWSRAFRSRRIHIGMDEAHLLGRGRSLDFHGYENPFGIFKRHLARVGGLAGKYGFHPMIWSDMYFRLGSASRDYYDSCAVIPDEVRETIPRNIELVYWDYYHTDPGIYDRMIDRHVKLGFRPVMASGLWSWYRFWYDHRYSAERVKPCIESCRRNHLTELFFTMWGDDGAYCEFDSMLAGLAWASDLCYGNDGDDRRTRLQILVLLQFLFVQVDVELLQQLLVFLFGGHDLDVPADFLAEDLERGLIQGLGGRGHFTKVEQHGDQRRRIDVDLLGQIGEGRTLTQTDFLSVAGRNAHAADDRSRDAESVSYTHLRAHET